MTIGPYEIRGELGKGAMGKVMLGWDPKLECMVAIKSVRVEGLQTDRHELESRLLREARAAAQLNHPGIVKIKHMLEIDGSGYIVMEFVKGRTLDSIAPPGQIADTSLTLRVLRESAAALDHAHARNIVHRDIKPGNIMIDDETGAVLITDFGIAKIMDSENQTSPGTILGTLDYMAPEQFISGTVDGRADQFALGVIAYRMLTGARIYSADTLRRLSYQIANLAPPSAHSLNPALPPAIDAVFDKVLSKTPEERYPSCHDFVVALEAVLLGTQGFSTHPGERYGDSPAQPGFDLAPDRGTELIRDVASPASSQTAPRMDHPPETPPPSAPAVKPRSRLPLIAAIVGGVVIIGGIAAIMLAPAPKPKPIAIADSSSAPAAPQRTLSMPSGDMVLVEGGDALLGENPKTVSVPEFYIDKTEVTNAAYLAYCRATGRAIPAGADKASPDDPVVGVSFNDAAAFAQWAGKRIPTAQEWEKAARGSSGQNFPWGNQWNDGVANVPKDEASRKVLSLASADSFPGGQSPYHALNMIGNVWEWTATADRPDPREIELLKRSPMFRDLQPPLSASEEMYQVRGGSYKYSLHEELPAGNPNRVNPASLVWDWMVMPARVSRDDIGFRCAKNR